MAAVLHDKLALACFPFAINPVVRTRSGHDIAMAAQLLLLYCANAIPFPICRCNTADAQTDRLISPHDVGLSLLPLVKSFKSSVGLEPIPFQSLSLWSSDSC